VLAVVLYHYAPGIAPGGFLGVDVFFVLSGYLIASLLVVEWQRDLAVGLRAFWIRRARRLFPALGLLLAACGIWALLATPPVEAHRVAYDGLAAFTYVANWHFIASSQSYLTARIGHRPRSSTSGRWRSRSSSTSSGPSWSRSSASSRLGLTAVRHDNEACFAAVCSARAWYLPLPRSRGWRCCTDRATTQPASISAPTRTPGFCSSASPSA